jgi:hypothetical protein
MLAALTLALLLGADSDTSECLKPPKSAGIRVQCVIHEKRADGVYCQATCACQGLSDAGYVGPLLKTSGHKDDAACTQALETKCLARQKSGCLQSKQK